MLVGQCLCFACEQNTATVSVARDGFVSSHTQHQDCPTKQRLVRVIFFCFFLQPLCTKSAHSVL